MSTHTRTHDHLRRLLVPALALAALVAGGEALEASMASGAPLPTPTAPEPAPTDPGMTSPENAARAMALESRAWEMRDSMKDRGRAARLYRQAAELRGAADPMKVTNLRYAARMSYHAGQLDRAAHDAAQAADVALRQGDPVQAAHAWLDAAWVLARDGKAAEAARHLEQAMVVAGSPFIPETERARIDARVNQAGTGVTASR